ncbi:MAG: SDR family NAD(P)-dependent oxidoreductase [Balneolaceae bacterium]
MNYKNNIVWITGASSGIGEAFARAFFKEGAKLILSSRRIETLEEVRDALGGDESNCFILPLDLADSESLPKKTTEALKAFGNIDVLVNNGGISQRSLFAESDMSTIRRLMEVNFFGSAELTRTILPSMIERKSGHIIVTSSVAGKFGTKFRSGYAASKHALHGLFDCIRQEMYEHNVAITMVCPGPIKTNITQNSLTADGSDFGKMGDLHKTAMDADEMVSRIWGNIKKQKEEIYISSPKERLALLVKRISPRLLNIILKNSKVT